MNTTRIATSNPFVFLLVDWTPTLLGTYPNIRCAVTYNFRLEFTGASVYYGADTTFTFNNQQHFIKLNLSYSPTYRVTGNLISNSVLYLPYNNSINSTYHEWGVGVVGFDFSGSSNISNTFSIPTPTLENKDYTPTVVSTSVDGVSLITRYTGVRDPYNWWRYRIEIKPYGVPFDNKTGIYVPTVDYADTLTDCDGLIPDTRYWCRIVLIDRNNVIGYSASEATDFYTLPDNPEIYVKIAGVWVLGDLFYKRDGYPKIESLYVKINEIWKEGDK